MVTGGQFSSPWKILFTKPLLAELRTSMMNFPLIIQLPWVNQCMYIHSWQYVFFITFDNRESPIDINSHWRWVIVLLHVWSFGNVSSSALCACVCVCGCPSNVGPKSEFFAPSVYINRLFIVFMGINQLYLLYLWVSISCQYCRIDYCYDFFGHDQTIDWFIVIH